VTTPEDFIRFWRALDDLVSTVDPAPWGAVVTDGRFPAIWDTNYARLDRPSPDIDLADVEAALLPALRRAGAEHVHIVSFFPEEHHRLLAEASTRGDTLTWDVVMRHDVPLADDDRAIAIEELVPGEELWTAVHDSMEVFGIDRADVSEQLRMLEVEVLAPSGVKRWFGVREPGGRRIAAIAAILRLEGVAYVDNVATFPWARGRGYASALTAHCVTAAAGEPTFLLVDPEGPRSLYSRIGFREVGRLASTRRPLS